MDNLKVNTDRPELSKEDILKHKNFDQVYQVYQAYHKVSNPFYKSFKFWATGVSCVVVATGVSIAIVMMNEKPGDAAESNLIAQQEQIMPSQENNELKLAAAKEMEANNQGDQSNADAPDSAAGAELVLVADGSIDIPAPPRKAGKNKPRFNIDFMSSEFPELTAYEGVLFEVNLDKCEYDKSIEKITWDITLDRLEDEEYKMTLTKLDSSLTLIAYPVYEGRDYENARKLYQQKYARY